MKKMDFPEFIVMNCLPQNIQTLRYIFNSKSTPSYSPIPEIANIEP